MIGLLIDMPVVAAGDARDDGPNRSLDALHAHINILRNPQRPLLCPVPIPLQHPHLVIRRAEVADRDPLAAFNAMVHGDERKFGGYTRTFFDNHGEDVMHPVVDPGVFTVVIDISVEMNNAVADQSIKTGSENAKYMTRDGLIVSSTLSIPQVWMYGDTDPSSTSPSTSTVPRIPILAVRPEGVGTHPDYRSKGLVEQQLEVHHAWAEALGADLCFVTGVRGFYRRFGYELAPSYLGGRGGYLASIPKIKTRKPVGANGEASQEPYTIRKATLSDVSFITRVDRINSMRRRHLACDADEAWWRNMIGGRRIEGSYNKRDVFIIQIALTPKNAYDTTDRRVGFFQLSNTIDTIVRYEIDPTIKRGGHSWSSITPTVLRWLPIYSLERRRAISKEFPAPERLPDTWTFHLHLSQKHPCFQSIRSIVHLPIISSEYRLYTKLLNLPQFLHRIAPVLTHRLQKSVVWSEFTGTVAMLVNPSDAGAKGGTLLNIVDGRVESVVEAPRRVDEVKLMSEGVEVFSVGGGTLLVSLIAGLEDASGLLEKFPGDCLSSGVAAPLLDTLFPGRGVGGMNAAEIYPLD
ncbi:hypothetical protein HDU67_003464 [Dinochytrium kinnereticum]|nr:hypothetical protein HDU67_003464 [Dinochytrium kinnereticum]